MKIKEGKPAELIPVKIEDCEGGNTYMVTAKRSRQFPKLGRRPYVLECFDLTTSVVFSGSGVVLYPKDIKGVWEIRQ